MPPKIQRDFRYSPGVGPQFNHLHHALNESLVGHGLLQVYGCGHFPWRYKIIKNIWLITCRIAGKSLALTPNCCKLIFLRLVGNKLCSAAGSLIK